MKIKGVEGYSPETLRDEINRGAKLVIFTYCVSLFVVTLKRPSSIYFVRSGQSRLTKGLPFSLVSLLLGWWGIPWGPIYTIESMIRNFSGGMDVTDEVMQSIAPNAPTPNQPPQLTQNQPPPPKDKASLTLRQKLIGGGTVALILLSLYAFWCANSATRSIYIISGLPNAYTVSLNGEKIALRPYGMTRIEKPEGKFTLTETPDGATETFSFETPFWSRPFDDQIVVLNPDKQALYYQHNVIYYSEKNSNIPKDESVDYTLFANRRVNILPKTDYVFEEPPRNIQMSDNQTTSSRTALEHFTQLGPQGACNLIEKKLGQAALETYLQTLISLRGDDEEALSAIIASVKPEKTLVLFESRIHDRPLRVNLHRWYQDLSKRIRPEFDLAAQYTALADKEPANGAFQYLLGRIQENKTEASACYQRALSASQPCAFAHIGLCSLELAATNYEAALEHCDEAGKNGVSSGTTREARKAALLALHRYDDLISDLKKLRQKTPFDIELAAEEIRFTLLKTPETNAVKGLIDNFCQTALKNWNDSDKPKARAYLEGIAACALGDEKTFAEKMAVFPGALMRFQAAVCERNFKAAAESITPEAPSDYQLIVYMLASAAGDVEAAAKSWSTAETALHQEYAQPEMIALLEAKSSATPEAICQLQVMPDRKRILLAALGLRFPQHRSVFHTHASKLNNYPDFSRTLIDSIVHQRTASSEK